MRQVKMLLLEIKVAFAGDGYEMDVGMRHFETDNGHADALARDGFLYGLGHMLGKHHHLTEFLIFDIEDVIGLVFGNDERMTFRQRIDVEKCKKTVVFGNFITRDFTVDDSGKDGRHSGKLLTGDFEDFEDHFTSWDGDFGHLTDLLTKEALSDRRVDGKLS